MTARLAVLVLAFASLPATAAPSSSDPIGSLLERRARAVNDGDAAAFRATMSDAPPAFRARALARFRALRSLPLASYSIEVSDDGYTDLAGALRHVPVGDEVHVVEAVERIRLRRYDAVPSAETLYLTVVRRGARWSIVADEELDDLGLRSSRNLWDFGPVERTERDGVLVLSHGEPATAARILTATVAALERTQHGWPLRFPARAVVAIPLTSAELGRILEATFDLGPFVAFLVSSVDRNRRRDVVFSAHRVYVQPDTFFSYSEGFQQLTLGHELLHLATRPAAGAFVPAWLDEGVAQVYGEGGSQSESILAGRARAGTLRGLPDDVDFLVGDRTSIGAAYQASASFVAWLRDRYGAAAGARLYRVLGRISAVRFGTPRYHLDRAARKVFSRPINRLERVWIDDLRERYT